MTGSRAKDPFIGYWGWVAIGVAVGGAYAVTLARWTPADSLSAMVSVLAMTVGLLLPIALRRLGARATERAFFNYVLSGSAAAAFAIVVTGSDPLCQGDLLAIMVAVGHAIGRRGCLVHGCCHGRILVPVAVKLVAESGTDEVTARGHDVPVREAEMVVNSLLGALGTLLAVQAPCGNALLAYLTVYPVARFWLDEARNPRFRTPLGPLSKAQWTSLILSLTVALVATIGGLPSRWPALVAAAFLCLSAISILRRVPRSTVGAL